MDAQYAVACARRQVTWRQRTPRGAQPTAPRALGAPGSRATAESRRATARLLHNPPAAREVVNVREQGHRRRDHDEAVKMVNFSRTRKPAKCDLDKSNAQIAGPGSFTATRFARVSIDTTFKTGLSL